MESVQSVSAKKRPGQPCFLQLAHKVCGEELAQRIEDCGLPIYYTNHSPFNFFYLATVAALKKFQGRISMPAVDEEYYICRMVKGSVLPAQNYRNLFELELRVFKEMCGQDLKLWCYHMIIYQNMAVPHKKSGAKVILHVLRCLLPRESSQVPCIFVTFVHFPCGLAFLVVA